MIRGIAISGKAASGKSSLADAVVLELVRRGYHTCRISFGDPIREEVRAKYGLTKAQPDYRARMIEVGDGARKRDPEWWIRRIAPTVHRCLQEHRVIVIDDLRFRAEYDWLWLAGFKLVRVTASEPLRSKRLAARGEDPWFAFSLETGETELDTHLFWHDVRTYDGDGAERRLRDAAREIVWKAERG